MINSQTTSPTMLCYQKIMNAYRAARNCSNHTLPSLFCNSQDVWYFSQVSYLLPKSSARLLTNHKLGQTFGAHGSLKSSPKPHAGRWCFRTLTGHFSGVPWVSTLMPCLALLYSASKGGPALRVGSSVHQWSSLLSRNITGFSQGLKY